MIVKAVSKSYDGRKVLQLPGFELQTGKVCALIGANGSGKSTLAKLLAGVIAADGGAVTFDDRPDTGYMPQKSFAFRMSAERNLRLGGGNAGEARAMLEKLGLSHLADKGAKSLSGGELARLALGRVLIAPHELLVLDEPTASMDMESTLLAEELIRDYCVKNSAAVLLVTHSLAQAGRMADELMFLSKGKLVEAGSAEKMLKTPEKEETKRFLEFYGK